jgi:glycosyltransferase involved in cell wall biosynthesis
LQDPPDHEAAKGEWVGRLPVGARIVAYAGTFESYQGLELLLGAFQRLRESVADAFLLLIGGTPAQVETYRQMAHQLGVIEHCLFTGSLPQAVTRSLLKRAAVLTSPRGTGTQTPLKVYEILAAGQPLVATRIPAHTQVLSDGVCFLCEADADAFAAALREALLDRGQAARLAAEGRSLYETRYSRRAYLEKMQRLLEDLA